MKRFAMLLGLSIATAWAASPTFEVVSIRPLTARMGLREFKQDPGRVTLRNATVNWLLTWAYDIQDYQVEGWPSWMGVTFYDVEAKTEQASTKPEMRAMMQTMLADRFGLKFHRESREMRVLMLIPDKNGVKLKPASDDGAQDVQSEPGKLKFKNIAALAGFMSGFLDHPVVDGTGLAGDFAITIQTPARRPAPIDGAAPDIGAQMNEFSDMLAQLVRDQLGLQVQSRKAPVEVFVIDEVRKPVD